MGKSLWLMLAALCLAVLPLSRDAIATAAPKKAVCAVCGPREGAGAEPVKATATYQGKEYSFCSEKCRDEFLMNPAAFLEPQTPRTAPAFSLKDLNGSTVSLADFKGKVLLVDFWATFCLPCVAAMPDLQKLHNRYAAQGFSVVGIATDTKPEGMKLVPLTVTKKKVTYPILWANPAAWETYDVTELPALFLIDRDGQIVKRFGGKTDHKAIEEAVKQLVAKPGGKG
jgi:peroxiredoxin